METHIQKFILSADSKALATYGDTGINVVPVSSINVIDGKIWLINYFMEKTVENIIKNKEVSLVCWTKMMGYQIRGGVVYNTDGVDFEAAKRWIKEILPHRTVKGLIVLTPTEIHDVSPTKDTKEKFIQTNNL